jgi:hypothetical protein
VVLSKEEKTPAFMEREDARAGGSKKDDGKTDCQYWAIVVLLSLTSCSAGVTEAKVPMQLTQSRFYDLRHL